MVRAQKQYFIAISKEIDVLVSPTGLLYDHPMRHSVAILVLPFFMFPFVGCDYESPTISEGDSSGSSSSSSSGSSMILECATICECPGGECSFNCGESGCGIAKCLNGASCTGSCGATAGSCQFQCDLRSTCDEACPNGNCIFTCNNQSDCKSTCPGGGCVQNCGNGATCDMDCTGAAIPCNLKCINGGKGTCKGSCNIPSCG